MPNRSLWGAGVCVLAMSAGCQAPSDSTHRSNQPSTAEAQQALGAEDTSADEHRLSWSVLTQRPQGFDQVGEGPNAVAVAHDGATLVLDRLGGRILRVDDAGNARNLAPVDEDVEDIAVGPDGAIVAYSPLRARAWILEPDGTPAGEVEISRSFRGVTAIGLEASRVVRLHTLHQETLTVGSPNAPLSLPVAMRTKKEGAYQLADGRGVAARVVGGEAVLMIVNQAQGRERSTVDVQHPVPGKVTAARVVGVSDSVACMRVEEVTSTPRISVSRRAVCMDVATGDVTLDRALPAKGTYLPRRELAVGDGTLAFMHPTADGLTVRRWSIRGEKEVAK